MTQGYHTFASNLSNKQIKSTVSAKHNRVKCEKTRYAIYGEKKVEGSGERVFFFLNKELFHITVEVDESKVCSVG